ncbi:MAG TPA: lysoplasmalogenase [Anaerolineaceae bacterium]|nr:lysoplasmalogenase [Anaerolineaceae bacterium]
MVTGWLVATLLFAVADWGAVATGRTRVRYGTKPATLLALIAWFGQIGGWQPSLIWFGLALVCSWFGDVFLLQIDRFFVPGLVSFFAAHVCYLIGFSLSPPELTWAAAIFLVLVVIAYGLVFPRILLAVQRNPKTALLRAPVILYGLVITLMFYSALLNLLRPGWPRQAALLTGVGAGLFFLSDSLLATNRFCRPFRFGELGVIVTYHLGQLALIWGVLLRFSTPAF